MSATATHSASASAAYSASAIETLLNDQLSALLGPINDLAVLWKIHDIVGKRIRAVEKATRGKPKKERDPDAPKKAAGPQLLAWNAEVARVEAVSAGAKKGKLTYNHARAVAGRLKEAGLLNVKKDATVLPTDEDILKAVEVYYKEVNPVSASAQASQKAETKPEKKKLKEQVEEEEAEAEEPVKETKKVEKAAMPNKKSEAKPEKKGETPNKKADKKSSEPVSMDPYDYIIEGKPYERLDINGYAFIWSEKGKYMGVYDEKKKSFDTSIADPTM